MRRMAGKFWLVMLMLAGCLGVTAGTSLEEDMAQMLEWFTGRFDNHFQVWEAKEAETDASLIHEHIHSIFARVDMPAFGNQVFYVEQYMDGDAEKIYRQRLYVFETDKKEKAIVLRIFAFPDAKAVAGAHMDPGKLAGVTPENVRATPGCEVYWRRNGDHFLGSMKEGACRIKSRRSGKTLIISDDLYLDEDEIWIRDKAVDDAGNYVFGHKGNVHHKLAKVRAFEGWAAMKQEGETEWRSMRGIKMHDRGGKIALVDGDGKAMGYSVELTQLVYNKKTPVFKLAIYKDGEEKSTAYTWANPEATRIGINLRWLQVGLTMAQPK